MKVAARHMLPVELLAAAISMALGTIAAFGRGPLWAALQAFPPWLGVAQNVWWGAVYLSAGLVLVAAARDELHHGRHWASRRLMLWADVRCGAALALIVAHLSLIAMLAVTGMWALWGVMLVASILAGFLGWCAFITRRLSICLDPRKRTPGLDALIKEGW